jgi:hypothetical protein
MKCGNARVSADDQSRRCSLPPCRRASSCGALDWNSRLCLLEPLPNGPSAVTAVLSQSRLLRHHETESDLPIQCSQLPVGFFIEIAMALTHVALQQDGSVLPLTSKGMPL